jgi:hypothetical protein
MKKTDLEKLVFEIQEELRYLRSENTTLKNLVKTQRENYLEVIEKWEESIDRFYERNVKGGD